VCTWFGHYME